MNGDNEIFILFISNLCLFPKQKRCNLYELGQKTVGGIIHLTCLPNYDANKTQNLRKITYKRRMTNI